MAKGHTTREIVVSARRTALALASVSIVFFCLSIIASVARWQYGMEAAWIRGLDLDNEKNAPTIFSGCIIALAALLAWLNGRAERVATRVSRWRVLSAGMLVMAIDEVFHFHERLIDPMRAVLGGGDLGVFTFAWVVPALIVLPIVALYMLAWLRALPADTARGFVFSGMVFVGGAVGLEMVGGSVFADHGSGFALAMIANVEEVFEMLGICCFIYVALRHLSREGPAVAVAVRP